MNDRKKWKDTDNDHLCIYSRSYPDCIVIDVSNNEFYASPAQLPEIIAGLQSYLPKQEKPEPVGWVNVSPDGVHEYTPNETSTELLEVSKWPSWNKRYTVYLNAAPVVNPNPDPIKLTAGDCVNYLASEYATDYPKDFPLISGYRNYTVIINGRSVTVSVAFADDPAPVAKPSKDTAALDGVLRMLMNKLDATALHHDPRPAIGQIVRNIADMIGDDPAPVETPTPEPVKDHTTFLTDVMHKLEGYAAGNPHYYLQDLLASIKKELEIKP